MIILKSFGKVTAQNNWIISSTKIIENLEVPICSIQRYLESMQIHYLLIREDKEISQSH